MAALQKLQETRERQHHLQDSRVYEAELSRMRCELYNECIKKRKHEKMMKKKRLALEEADAAIKLNAEELLTAVSDIGRAHRDAEEAKRLKHLSEKNRELERRNQRSRILGRTMTAASKVRAKEEQKQAEIEEKERLRTVRQNEIKTAREDARAAGDARKTQLDATRVVEVRRHTPPPIRSPGQITLDYMRRNMNTGDLPNPSDIRVIRHVSPMVTHRATARSYIPLSNVTVDLDSGVSNEASHEDMRGLKKMYSRVLGQLKNKWVQKARNKQAHSTLGEEEALGKFELALKTLSSMDIRAERVKKRVNQIEHITYGARVDIEQQFEHMFVHAEPPKITRQVRGQQEQDGTEADDVRVRAVANAAADKVVSSDRETDGEFDPDSLAEEDSDDEEEEEERMTSPLSQSLKWKVYGKNDFLPAVTAPEPEQQTLDLEPETSFEREDQHQQQHQQQQQQSQETGSGSDELLFSDSVYDRDAVRSSSDLPGEGSIDLGQTMRLPKNVTFGLSRSGASASSSDGYVEDWLLGGSGRSSGDGNIPNGEDGAGDDDPRYSNMYRAGNVFAPGGFLGDAADEEEGEENDLLYNLRVNVDNEPNSTGFSNSAPLSLDMDFDFNEDGESPSPSKVGGDINGSMGSSDSSMFDPDRTISTLNKHSSGAAYYSSIPSDSSAIALDNIRRDTVSDVAVTTVTTATGEDITTTSNVTAGAGAVADIGVDSSNNAAASSTEWVVAAEDLAPFTALRESIDAKAAVRASINSNADMGMDINGVASLDEEEEEAINPNIYTASPVPYSSSPRLETAVSEHISASSELVDNTASTVARNLSSTAVVSATAGGLAKSASTMSAARTRLNKTVGDKPAPSSLTKKPAVPVQPGIRLREVKAVPKATTQHPKAPVRAPGPPVVKTEVGIIENKLAEHVKARLAAPLPASRINTNVSAGDALAGAIANSLSAPPVKKQPKHKAANAAPKSPAVDTKPLAIRPAPLLSNRGKSSAGKSAAKSSGTSNVATVVTATRGSVLSTRQEIRPRPVQPAILAPSRITAISAASNLVDVSPAVADSVEVNTHIEAERLEREHVIQKFSDDDIGSSVRKGELQEQALLDDSGPSASLSGDSLERNETSTATAGSDSDDDGAADLQSSRVMHRDVNMARDLAPKSIISGSVAAPDSGGYGSGSLSGSQQSRSQTDFSSNSGSSSGSRTDSSANFFEQFDQFETEDINSNSALHTSNYSSGSRQMYSSSSGHVNSSSSSGSGSISSDSITNSTSNLNTSDSFLRQITGAPRHPVTVTAIGGSSKASHMNVNDSNYVRYLHKNISMLSADTHLSDDSMSTGISEMNNTTNNTNHTSAFLDELQEMSMSGNSDTNNNNNNYSNSSRGTDSSSRSGSSGDGGDSSTGDSDNSNVSLEELLQFNSKSDRIRQEWQNKLNSATATVEASESQAMQSLLGELSELRSLDGEVDGIVEDMVREQDFNYFDLDAKTNSSSSSSAGSRSTGTGTGPGSGSGSSSGSASRTVSSSSSSGSRFEIESSHSSSSGADAGGRHAAGRATGSANASSITGGGFGSVGQDENEDDNDDETVDSLDFLGVERDDLLSVSGTTESTAEVQFLKSLMKQAHHTSGSASKKTVRSDSSSAVPRHRPSSTSSSTSFPASVPLSTENSALDLDVSSSSTPSWLLFVDENNNSVASSTATGLGEASNSSELLDTRASTDIDLDGVD